MDDTSNGLCQRILEKCQQQRWYGPDIYVPNQVQRDLGDRGTIFWYDRNGQQYPINRHTDIDKIPTVWAFEHAPVTEEQVQRAEQILGFSLPPLLHAIYTRIANGGFGPGYGLPHLTDTSLSSRRQARLVDFSVFEKQTPDAKRIMIPDYVWPNDFFCLCHWGCAIYSYLDIHTGRVFREAYYEDNKYGFECEALSLEAWFELSLDKGIDMFDL